MFPWYTKYPYQNDEVLNLDWTLKTIDNLVKEVSDFVSLNTIKYADPIQWNITTQYEKNTVVIDPISGSAYISTKPVPAGVGLNNTDYWNLIFTLDVISANKNITLRDDANNMLATFESNVDDWLLWQGTLYIVTQDISIGQAYVEDYNISRYTVERFIKDYIANLKTYIDNEITARTDADTLLQTSINNEITARTDADTLLRTSIDNEITARTEADTLLQNSINSLLSTINNNILPNIDNIHDYVISVGVGCDFTTINAAVSEMRTRIANNEIPSGARPIIAIHSGTYDESVNLLNCPNITLIGIDGPHTVTIVTTESAYPDSPIHVSGSATIINLTMNGTRSYGMHYEYQNGPTSGDVRFYNCEFASTNYAAAGIGMGPNCSLSFFDCTFVSTGSPQAGVFFFHNYPFSASNMEISLYNCRIFDAVNASDYNTIRWDDVNQTAGDSLLSFRMYNTIVSPPTFKFQKVDGSYSDSVVSNNNGNLMLSVNNNVIGLESSNYGVITEDVVIGMLQFDNDESYTVIPCDNAYYYNLSIDHLYTSSNVDIASQVTSFIPANDSSLLLRCSNISVIGQPVRVVFTKILK